MRPFPLLAAALAASGCATDAGSAGADDSLRSITFETGPCFGACPVYSVTVAADGSGSFDGRRFTAVTGERGFTATPAQFRAFAAHLAPLRPRAQDVRYSGGNCEMMATDLPSTEVTWTRADGARQSLYFYHGCDMERNRPIAERLNAAPALLPVAEMIGTRR